MYWTLTYHISLDGAAEAYDFLESHEMMSWATGQDSKTYVMKRLNPFFIYLLKLQFHCF